MYGDLVSIIMPAYNCETFISKSIQSVINQTYKNVELLIADDGSTDKTADIIAEYAEKYDNVKYFRLEKNSGAANARNYLIKAAQGVYLAFLDSDDIWLPKKLEHQIKFMENNNYYFTCTDYGKIDEYDNQKDVLIHALKQYDYNTFLKDCPGNSTIVYNASVLGKFYAANIRRRNDFVMWLQVIKRAKCAYGLNETLGYHRERADSISINKRDLLKYQWIVYRKIEKLTILRCYSLMIYKILKTIGLRLRMKIKDEF